MNWQPIDTAPKDGTWVLLFGTPGVIPHVGRWLDEGWRNSHYGEREPYWRFSGLTHWMPLPEAPK